MVKALHKAGIAVILDTGFQPYERGEHLWPYHQFQGILQRDSLSSRANRTSQYYMDNYTGCGNTVNCQPPDRAEIHLGSVWNYWVTQMHVDGFRFDEGSILSRESEDGIPMAHPPVVWSIELTEALAGVQDDRRSLGCGRLIPNRLFSRLSLGGMERPLPR